MMLFMSKQVILLKISSILQKPKIVPKCYKLPFLHEILQFIPFILISLLSKLKRFALFQFMPSSLIILVSISLCILLVYFHLISHNKKHVVSSLKNKLQKHHVVHQNDILLKYTIYNDYNRSVLVNFCSGAQLQNREANLSRNQGTYNEQKEVPETFFYSTLKTCQIFKLHGHHKISQRR